jgi:hypothetical protein
MCRAFRSLPLLLILAAPVASAASGEEYWAYSYRNVDVTAAGKDAYAVNLAHYCVRLDAMLTRILGVKTAYRAPTHIYALPGDQLRQYLGDNSTVSFHVTPYEIFIVTDNSAAPNSDYWGAYFGYTGALLAMDGQLRGPDWYMLGVPLIFASTSYQHGRVKLGNADVGYGLKLGQGGSLIPLRTLLAQKKSEVVASSGHNLKMYDAEAWALAHEVFVEGWHRAEFGKYLELLRQGTGESAAFAASFNLSYEQLDKEFAYAIQQRPYVYTMEEIGDATRGHEVLERLSVADIKGRLALLTVRLGRGPDAVRLANEALQMEPNNQTALRALALAQLARGAYGESLIAVDKLSAQSPTPPAYADSAEVLEGLADAVVDGKAALPVDAAMLRQRAKEDYEHALLANSEDRRSHAGVVRLGRSP